MNKFSATIIRHPFPTPSTFLSKNSQRFASTATVAPMTDAFVRNIEHFVEREGVDMVVFDRKQRKDDVTQEYLQRFKKTEGLLYVGKAQEEARVMRTERRRSQTGRHLSVDR